MGPEPGKPSDIPEGGSLEEKWYTSYVAHAFNAGTQEAKTGGSREFQASLVYIVTSRAAKAV